MSKLYETLSALCESRGITLYRMCRDLGIQPSIMTDLKMGRRKSVKAETAAKIAEYFNTTVDFLLTGEQKEKSPAETEDDIDVMVDSILSGLTDSGSDTLMLDGKPASAEALYYLRESIRANVEHAKKLNDEKKAKEKG